VLAPQDHPRRFDYTAAMRRLCVDICQRMADLRHIEMRRVAVGFVQARKLTPYGAYASLTPLRFPGGMLEQVRRGRRYTLQRLYDGTGDEMLYILNFYLPRFQELPFDEKLITVFHELWHVSPSFDGDIRRFAGRCCVHSPSQHRYDAQMATLSQNWLAQQPPADIYQFLELGYRQLADLHGPIVGHRYARPKMIPLPARI
jgi:hypothetical protein